MPRGVRGLHGGPDATPEEIAPPVPGSTLDAARAAFCLGALAERADRNGAATEWYADAAALAPAGPFAPEAHWWRGSLLARARRYVEAVAAFDAVVMGFGGSSWAGRAMLEASLAAEHAGARDDAAQRLRAIASTRPAAEAATALYWLERLGLRTTDDAVARGATPYSFAALIEDPGTTVRLPASAQREWDASPGDWAAAEARLKARFSAPPAEAHAAADDPTMHLALAMVSVGEREAAGRCCSRRRPRIPRDRTRRSRGGGRPRQQVSRMWELR